LLGESRPLALRLKSDGISAISAAVILWNVGAALDQSQRQLGTPATGRKGFTGDTIAVTAGFQILDGTPAVCPMYYSGTRVCPYIRGWREDSARCLFGRPLLHSLLGGFLPGCSLSRKISQAFFTAAPFRSVPQDAAVAEVFGTLSVLVGITRTC